MNRHWPLFFYAFTAVSSILTVPALAQSPAPGALRGGEPSPADTVPSTHSTSAEGESIDRAVGEVTVPTSSPPYPPPGLDDYVNSLVESALEKGLDREIQWRRLGHWRSGWFGGWTSEADGPALFLAPDGRTNPTAELEATIRGFFDTPPPPAPPVEEGDTFRASPHPLCRFPARFLWLRKALAIDPARLPPVVCARLMDFWARTRPTRISLVFSSYYLNNPSSAFGHTFLRVHKQRTLAEAEKQSLLDSGIDFSAVVTTDNAFLYGVMGMIGLFEGHFSRMPYFYKVREYNDYESRDLWEYDLDLSPEVLTMFISHIWELGASYFDYFYMTENCSYHILGALEAADPNLELLSHLRSLVLPVDTLHAVERTPGLVKGIRFRPALQTRFEARARQLTDAQRAFMYVLADEPQTKTPAGFEPQDEIAALDGAADYIDLVDAEDILRDKDSDPARRKQAVLERRAKIRVPSPPLKVVTPTHRAPHLTHDTSRLGLGAGMTQGGGLFQIVDWRAHLHDLADPTPGLPELSQLEFFPTRLRLSAADKKVWLDQIDLVHVGILNPMTQFNLMPSWDFRVGVRRFRDPGCTDCVGGRTSIKGGTALAFFDEALTLFLLSDLQVHYSASLEGLGETGFRLGLGAVGGLRLRLAPNFIMLASGVWREYPWAPFERDWSADATVRWAFSRHFALGLEGRHTPRSSEAGALLYVYY